MRSVPTFFEPAHEPLNDVPLAIKVLVEAGKACVAILVSFRVNDRIPWPSRYSSIHYTATPIVGQPHRSTKPTTWR